MKKLQLLFAALLTAAAAQAQINKSATLLGGEFRYLNYEDDAADNNISSSSGLFHISAGKAIKEATVVGITLGFQPINYKDFRPGGDSIDRAENRFYAGVFYREYRPLAKNLYYYGQVNLEGFGGTYKEVHANADRNQTFTQKGGYMSLDAGIAYQLFRRVQFEVSIPALLSAQYLVRNSDHANNQGKEDKYRQFSAGSSLSNFQIVSLSGGFRFIF